MLAVVDKRKTILVVILSVCTLFTLFFIFGNSVESKAESSVRSGRLLTFLKETIGLDFLTHNTVRKIAHVLEFSLLGFFVEEIFLLTLRKNIRGLSLVFTVLFGLLSALLDETIQIYTNRGSQVIDVWLDLSGVLLGMVFGLILYCTVKYIVKKRGDKKTNG